MSSVEALMCLIIYCKYNMTLAIYIGLYSETRFGLCFNHFKMCMKKVKRSIAHFEHLFKLFIVNII